MQIPIELTIIKDRYGGMYSGGRYTAWNIPFTEIPKSVDGCDIDCENFWRVYLVLKPKKYQMIVGFGNTPQSALEDLIEKMNN